jgi:hypothetical protein
MRCWRCDRALEAMLGEGEEYQPKDRIAVQRRREIRVRSKLIGRRL